MKNNPYGSLDRKLDLGQFYEKRNTLDEFLSSASFKAIEPDMVSWERDSAGGMWITTSAGNKKQIPFTRVKEAYDKWINHEAQGYAQYMQKYGGERWLNEDNKVELLKKGYKGYDDLSALLKITAGKTTSSAHRLQVNSNYWNQLSHAENARRGREGSGKSSSNELALSTSIGLVYNSQDKNLQQIVSKIKNLKGEGEDIKKLKEITKNLTKSNFREMSIFLRGKNIPKDIQDLWDQYKKGNSRYNLYAEGNMEAYFKTNNKVKYDSKSLLPVFNANDNANTKYRYIDVYGITRGEKKSNGQIMNELQQELKDRGNDLNNIKYEYETGVSIDADGNEQYTQIITAVNKNNSTPILNVYKILEEQ